MFRVAILLAGIWGSAGSAACNADLALMQMSASANHTLLSPSPAPTPAPTYPPGIPCDCLPGACFAAYDTNNDSCITNDECDVQTPLKGCWDTQWAYRDPVWDTNGDGCINYTEFLALNLSEVCPVTPPPPACSCPPGEYICGYTEESECKCCICDGASRRRRSLSCDTCPAGKIHIPEDDDCVCAAEPFLMTDTLNGSCMLDTQLSQPPNYFVGDNISIVTRMSGKVARMQGPINVCEGGSDCRNATINTAIIEEIRGSDIYITPCPPGLADDFIKYDPIILTCTTVDGTDNSRKYTTVCNGESVCQCGYEQCNKYEICDCTTGYPDCVCEPAGPYPDHPTPAPTVGAKGDPHLVNIQGEHFDINHAGEFTLLRLPQAGKETDKPAELEVKALVLPEFEHPCTTYITQVMISGSWLGNKTVQARSYLKDHPGKVIGTYLGARVVDEGVDPKDADWDSIETFLADTPELTLSTPDSEMEVTLVKSQWFPKKEITTGVPTVAGMFTLTVRKSQSTVASKLVIRQDLPEQEHLNLAVQKLSALGRADVGGLLGFDEHPEDLEQVSSSCNHYRASRKRRVESVQNNGYVPYKPAWKERWDKIREEKKHMKETKQGASGDEVGAEASLFGEGREKREGYQYEKSDANGMMCKCPDDIVGFDEGVLIEASSQYLHAQASWD